MTSASKSGQKMLLSQTTELDPQKKEEMRKLEKRFKMETIASHDIKQALKRIEKNVIVKYFI